MYHPVQPRRADIAKYIRQLTQRLYLARPAEFGQPVFDEATEIVEVSGGNFLLLARLMQLLNGEGA